MGLSELSLHYKVKKKEEPDPQLNYELGVPFNRAEPQGTGQCGGR